MPASSRARLRYDLMSSILYAVDAKPPSRIVWLNALQHIALSAVTLVFPRIVAEAAGADPDTIARYVGLSMVAMGIGTLIQTFGRREIGSGYLLLGHCTILYVPFAVEAARAGGLGAVAGLTVVAGCTGMLLSRFVRGLRAYIPPEIIGVVIFLLGAMLGLFGLRLMLGLGPQSHVTAVEIIASMITLATIMGAAIWGPAGLRSLAVLVGIVIGTASFAAMTIGFGDFSSVIPDVSAVDLRWPLARPSVPLTFIPGFIVGALACFIRAIADLTAFQQLANLDWKSPDFKVLRAGTLADGLGCVVAGLIGVMGTNTYSGSVGLAAANGVLSRRIGMTAGFGWIALGLIPGTASVLYAIPSGILGAACFYSATFTMRTGITMLSQRLVDTRRTLIIGTAIAVSMLVVDSRGHGNLPRFVLEVLNSPLATAMLLAVGLNALLRLGIPKSASLEWRLNAGFRTLDEFVETQGRIWGARVDLIERARNFLEEFAQAAPALIFPGTAIHFGIRQDEVGLKIEIVWKGHPMPQAGHMDVEVDDLKLQLALMRHWAQEVAISSQGSDHQLLRAHIDDR